MSDKVQLIKQEIERLFDEYPMSRGMLKHLTIFINSIPKESGCEANCTTKSEDLEKEILNKWEDDPHTLWHKCPYGDFKNIAYHFAEWQKQQMVEKAVEWIQNNIAKDFCFDEDLKARIPEFIEEFKKAMED